MLDCLAALLSCSLASAFRLVWLSSAHRAWRLSDSVRSSRPRRGISRSLRSSVRANSRLVSSALLQNLTDMIAFPMAANERCLQVSWVTLSRVLPFQLRFKLTPAQGVAETEARISAESCELETRLIQYRCRGRGGSQGMGEERTRCTTSAGKI